MNKAYEFFTEDNEKDCTGLVVLWEDNDAAVKFQERDHLYIPYKGEEYVQTYGAHPYHWLRPTKSWYVPEELLC